MSDWYENLNIKEKINELQDNTSIRNVGTHSEPYNTQFGFPKEFEGVFWYIGIY